MFHMQVANCEFPYCLVIASMVTVSNTQVSSWGTLFRRSEMIYHEELLLTLVSVVARRWVQLFRCTVLFSVIGGHTRLHLLDLGSCTKDHSGTCLSLSTLGSVLLAIANGQRYIPNQCVFAKPLLFPKCLDVGLLFHWWPQHLYAGNESREFLWWIAAQIYKYLSAC